MGETDGHLGPYELRGELGRGAMARVWRAWDPNLGREVAIKEPLFDAGLSGSVLDEMGRRFVKEARIAARLNHPGIVTIYAADVYDGRPAIVMELVEGATLGDILGRNGRLDPGAALDALDQLLDAVGYAHAQGVVHRDIKPDNVFVDEEGRVKLSDFGIARADNGATRATVAGAVLGTPGYMSPEQARGGAVDARSDLFSVGVVAYEMLTGRNPFGAGDGSDAVTLLYRIVHEPPPELPGDVCAGLDADLRPAVMAALEKEPGDRPQSAGEFKAMLHGGPPQAPAQPPAEPRAAAPRRWLPYAAAGVACVAALAIAFFSLGGARSSAPGAPSVAAGMYHLAVSGGRVAIFASGSDEPYEVTDVLASDLDRDSAAEVDGHISFASVQDAEEKVDAYAQAIGKKGQVVSTSSATSTQPSRSRYEFRADNCTWSEARDRAEKDGGHLAVITSSTEWDTVLAAIPSEEITVCWLGGHRNGKGEFAWVNGETFSFNRWANKEPNNDGGTEECLCALKAGAGWGWYDVPNDVSPYYAPHRIGYVVEFD